MVEMADFVEFSYIIYKILKNKLFLSLQLQLLTNDDAI